MISIRNLTKSYGNNLVLQNISVDIADGEVIAVIGPSGCGKSTFIRCINLLEQPDAGQIFIGNDEITKKGANIDAVRRKLGMVFQSFNLFSHKTVLENVILAPMHVLKLSEEQAVAEAMEYLEIVGIANRADYMPSQLSGGQKQRVAIARCLAMRPEVILFDEPTSALDPTMVDEVLSVIRKLVRRGLSCIIVTHEMNFARNVATRVFYMDEKGIYESGTPSDIFDHPQKEKTKIFINKLKVFTGEYAVEEIDLYEIMRQVTEYCLKYDMSKRETNKINLICEEYVTYLMRRQSSGERITISVRYNENDKSKEIVFKDNFPAGNHFESDDFDEVSAMLIKGFTKSVEYKRVDGQNVFGLKLT
ncbi:MAG: amino acid ABC transporter ATP-binding protein [Bacillota bacterium]|jgi:polar amino acid transport system ATP-binding protein